ncbi:TetR/AcrR family transcriptional regulator [Microbispora sp. GKU 823]|uniref:TetR/AcrR family transcriptional regulator n=1 Tax=Microbispora sp. GKU 823 TaxID=1652100 RepID=UPI0009A2F5B3|nr:TetR/AcrR family transcriptional regulator [Microbispora sp. GKU 823]OPG05664.1 TetR family transcriptional regulator [Microbispora sp. GKU 823]
MAELTTAGRPDSRGRIDKRRAILEAAFAVFAEQGYAQASVQEIAEAAGVAKLTVYNHFGDKESLFRQAMEVAADAVSAENLAVVDRLRDPGDDLRAVFEDVAYSLLQVCCGERSHALRRLTYGQIARTPDIVEIVQGRTGRRLAEALADRLARLSLSGRLRPCDPALAAEQFLALLTGPMEVRTALGTRTASPEEARGVADAAVDTFLRAYGPAAGA